MSTIVNFTQPTNAPFQFQATFDGSLYTVSVPWNAAGQRLYILIKDQNGNTVCNVPATSSIVSDAENPTGYNINLVQGYFTTNTLYWFAANNQFEVGP